MTRRDLKPSQFKRSQYDKMLELYDKTDGQIGYADLEKLWNVKHVQAVLYAFKHFGWPIPPLVDRRRGNGRKPKAERVQTKRDGVTCDPLNHYGCKLLAIDLAIETIREIRRGQNVETNVAFLRSKLGIMALDLADINPQKAINFILSENCI